MSIFYFHVKSGDHFELDEYGLECADLTAAREEAVAGARCILSNAIKFTRVSNVPDALVIADESGCELITVPLVEVLPVNLRPR